MSVCLKDGSNEWTCFGYVWMSIIIDGLCSACVCSMMPSILSRSGWWWSCWRFEVKGSSLIMVSQASGFNIHSRSNGWCCENVVDLCFHIDITGISYAFIVWHGQRTHLIRHHFRCLPLIRPQERASERWPFEFTKHLRKKPPRAILDDWRHTRTL